MALLRISILLHFPRSWQAISGTKIREWMRNQSSFQVPIKQKSKKTDQCTTAASQHHTNLLLRAWTCTDQCTLDSSRGWGSCWFHHVQAELQLGPKGLWVWATQCQNSPFSVNMMAKGNKATTSGPNLCMRLFVLQYILSCLSAFNAQDGLPRWC